MRSGRARTLAVLGAAACALAFLMGKAKLDRVGERDRWDRLLLELQKVDSFLDEQLLEARHAQLLNYDPIVANLQALQGGVARLEAASRGLEPGRDGRAALEGEVGRVAALVREKGELVERFKSENAALHNSLGFFPVAAGELADALDRPEHAMARDVHALLRDVLVHVLQSNDDLAPRIQARVEALGARERARAPAAAWGPDLRRVLDHATTVLERKTRVDRALREALDLPVRPALIRIQAGFAERSRRMVSVANDWRLALYLAAIALLAAVAYAHLRLHNASAALQEANATLERRVDERTADLRRAFAEREAMALDLARAERLAALGTLAGGAAHEINNPLAYVTSNLRFVSEALGEVDGAVPAAWLAEVREATQESLEGAARVKGIVQEFEAFARPGQRVLPLDLGPVLDRALDLAREKLRARARVVRDYREAPRVLGDAARLGQVALHLVSNAADAIPEGAPERHEVRVAVHAAGPDRVVLEVSDTGCGIAPEIRARVFEPFFTTKPVGQGTGLGLSVCHGVVTALGGEIAVESRLGEGTTFRVTLPAAPDGDPEVAPAAALPALAPRRALGRYPAA